LFEVNTNNTLKIITIIILSAVFFASVLWLMGSLHDYLFVYLKHIFLQKTSMNGTGAFVAKAFQVKKVYKELELFIFGFGFYSFILFLCAFIIMFFVSVTPKKELLTLAIHLFKNIFGVLLTVLATSLVTPQYGHHFVFAVPLFYLAAVVFWTPLLNAKNFVKFKYAFFVIFFPALLMFYKSVDNHRRLMFVNTHLSKTRIYSKALDEMLSACLVDRYQFIGGNGFQPYMFTEHSPIGPAFFQFDFHPAPRDEYLQKKLIEQINEAKVIVYERLNNFSIRSQVEDLVHKKFTSARMPSCAIEYSKRLYGKSNLRIFFRNDMF
jgi:hypothetical protein